MGIRNYLIEGVSGAGKTTVAEELQRRGYHVIHGDRTLAYVGDPQTGKVLKEPPAGANVDPLDWRHRHWIWPVDRVKALVEDQTHAVTSFCGGSRNYPSFIQLFDGVFVLDIDPETLKRRLDARPADEFGGKPEEQQFVLRLHATKEDVPVSGSLIDATRPISLVVDDILARCGGPLI